MGPIKSLLALIGLAALLVSGCHKADLGTANAPLTRDGAVLNLFWWSDFLAPNTLSNFEKQTGIKGFAG